MAGPDRPWARRRILARRDRADVRAGRAAAHRPADARDQGGRAGQDDPPADRHARRPAARRRLPGAEPHGMPNLPPPPASGRIWGDRSAEEEAPRRPLNEADLPYAEATAIS